jgi:hypothetical protein
MTLSRRAAWLLIAASVWTLYVWITRMWVIAGDSHGLAFKAVHAVLAIVSVGLAIPVGVIGWRALQATKAAKVNSAATRSDVEPRATVGRPPA